MKKKGKDLIFISQINRDGSGTTPVDPGYLDLMTADDYSKFKMQRLSLTEDTWIASHFNSFVVKIKRENPPSEVME